MTKRQEEVEILREYNLILLTNLMPEHVVHHFLIPDASVSALVSHFNFDFHHKYYTSISTLHTSINTFAGALL